MNTFMDEQFLLKTPSAQRLYHDYAEAMPIVDYHCHINPSEIAQDRTYDNITQVWLGGNGYGDHYKWRLMRANGVPERLITGVGDDYDKFMAFARILPSAAGNPVYHWTHLELKRYFGSDLVISEDTAPEIWELCNAALRGGLSAREIVRRSNVTGLATTDDPIDSLEWHEKIAADSAFETTVKPAWRPDKLLRIEKAEFAAYVRNLGEITDMDSLRAAVSARMDHFDAHGCRASDHGLETLEYVSATEQELNAILSKALGGKAISQGEAAAYQYAMMYFLGAQYSKRGWVMEIHYGARRNVNTKSFAVLGPDTGYDAIAPSTAMDGLPVLLDALHSADALPRTLLFSLNPGDNAMLSTLCGGFQREGESGWVQQGAAWWFNDSIVGMKEQLVRYASLAPLGTFLGMVTDSRSFLSYTRHEYFRRILCNLLGKWVESGEYPADFARLGEMVQNISYYNAKRAFGF